jgi:hypothetical protein
MSGKPGRSGRKTFVPTADQRNTVKVMASFGIAEDKICLTVINPQTNKPISKPTLQRAFRHEIATAQTQLNTAIATALVDAALGRRPSGGEPIKNDRARVDAMKFFLEFRAGWQRGVTLQHGNPTGPDGNPIPFFYYANPTDAKL